MITKRIHFLLFTFLITAFTIAQVPGNIKDILKKMYPRASGIAWTQRGNYYVADFIHEGLEIDVWFNRTGQWVMTGTNLETTDSLPPIIYNSLAIGQYSSYPVDGVWKFVFPNCPAMIVIEVGVYNMDTSYQLFYLPNGILANVRNTVFGKSLWPQTVGCH